MTGHPHHTEPSTAAEARDMAAACARRIGICINAGKYDEARHQMAEAKRFAILALELEREPSNVA